MIYLNILCVIIGYGIMLWLDVYKLKHIIWQEVKLAYEIEWKHHQYALQRSVKHSKDVKTASIENLWEYYANPIASNRRCSRCFIWWTRSFVTFVKTLNLDANTSLFVETIPASSLKDRLLKNHSNQLELDFNQCSWKQALIYKKALLELSNLTISIKREHINPIYVTDFIRFPIKLVFFIKISCHSLHRKEICLQKRSDEKQ